MQFSLTSSTLTISISSFVVSHFLNALQAILNSTFIIPRIQLCLCCNSRSKKSYFLVPGHAYIMFRTMNMQTLLLCQLFETSRFRIGNIMFSDFFSSPPQMLAITLVPCGQQIIFYQTTFEILTVFFPLLSGLGNCTLVLKS